MLTESNSAALCLPFICLVETTPPPILFPTEVLRVFGHAYQISKAKDAWFLQEFFEWHWFNRSLLRVPSWSIHTYTAVCLGWSVGFFSFSCRLSPLPSFCPHFSPSLSFPFFFIPPIILYYLHSFIQQTFSLLLIHISLSKDHGVLKSRAQLSNWTATTQTNITKPLLHGLFLSYCYCPVCTIVLWI